MRKDEGKEERRKRGIEKIDVQKGEGIRKQTIA